MLHFPKSQISRWCWIDLQNLNMRVFFQLACLAAPALASYSFISVGDWGGAAINDQDSSNVYAVAGAMATSSSALDAQFIIGTGDSKYNALVLTMYADCASLQTSIGAASSELPPPSHLCLLPLHLPSASSDHFLQKHQRLSD